MRNKKKTGNKILIILLVVLVAGGAVGYLSKGFKDLDYKNWFTSVEDDSSVDPNSDAAVVGVDNNGIDLKSIMSSDTTTKSFTYTISPTVHTGTVSYELTCPTGEVDPSEYYSIDLNTEVQQIDITLLKICNYQCSLKIYAIDDPTVNAVVTIDYQQRITNVSSTLNVVEGSPLTITNVVDKSGGSIFVDDSITSSSLEFNSTFISNVESLLGFGGQIFKGSKDSDEYVGLDNADSWLSGNYTSTDFLESIYHVVGYYQDRIVMPVKHYNRLIDQESEDVLSLFNGTAPVFNYTVTVNDEDYSTTFGLNIETIPVTGIDTSTDSIVF